MKWLDHALAELAFQVPAVIGHAEDRRHAPRVFDRRQRAATSMLRRLLGFTSRPLLERDPDDLVALRLQQGSSHRRINPTGHRNGDPHAGQLTKMVSGTRGLADEVEQPGPVRVGKESANGNETESKCQK